MIHNVFGKAVTESTLLELPEYKGRNFVVRGDLAKVALDFKNMQGKGRDEPEAMRYVESLRDECAEKHYTVGWIYNATGGAITLVDSHDWGGELASPNPYPVRIENGQWGLFLYVHAISDSSGAVLYEGFNSYYKTCHWCLAWKLTYSSTKVYVGVKKAAWGGSDEWNSVYKELHESASVHSAKQEGWHSVISASPGPHAVFEALLTMEHF